MAVIIFTACRTIRMQAAIERLKRVADYAEQKGVLLLLENLNWEPVLAEVNYMPVTPAETMHFLTEVQSPALRWSFTANHAHFLPGVGISNFIDAVDFSLCHEVRLADNNGSYEIHQRPGEGTIDFGAMFKKIEGLGYKGHYTNGFTTLDDMLAGRDYMLARAAKPALKSLAGEFSASGRQGPFNEIAGLMALAYNIEQHLSKNRPQPVIEQAGTGL